ncbi:MULTISPECIES: DUF6949 family protein [Methylorubrum]|jgi:hypothetical protein|uniref:Uncharacterized protein n=2 Tax=Methylorubrum extorquens TaxID=408 RepID=C5B2P0_METEA|nr:MULTISPECIES: hypothetical protein [Methylorubrum]ACS39895.1 conserved hypothetical protein; putative membrane protein [Methylorubrum extorquens AM1]EHP90286.1 hypothetical protein MetexDRAFT_4829 [Methylorubrum extorquens DSM 13060]MCP1541961.1 hypothetical protein [Methylorubrum extorquens]MCP1585502.1 hypothetical protein [Methylorubrum extorquens]BDL39500.1 hypothetical protein MSPGM_20900 [Methylorubrum sp. GM97]
MTVSPSSVESIQALIVGLALAGLLASAFEYATNRRASFRLLESGGVTALAALPMIAVVAPFIILRNTLRGRRIERRPIPFVMIATMIACGWSLLSGQIALGMAHRLAGL